MRFIRTYIPCEYLFQHKFPTSLYSQWSLHFCTVWFRCEFRKYRNFIIIFHSYTTAPYLLPMSKPRERYSTVKKTKQIEYAAQITCICIGSRFKVQRSLLVGADAKIPDTIIISRIGDTSKKEVRMQFVWR